MCNFFFFYCIFLSNKAADIFSPKSNEKVERKKYELKLID